MRFPNAQKGIGQIFLGEMLGLAAIIPMAVILFINALNGENASAEKMAESGAAVAILVCAIIFIILLIASAVVNLLGYINAARDNASFKNALFFLLIGAAFTASGTLMQSLGAGQFISDIFTTAGDLSEIFVTIFTILGLINLSVQYNDLKMINKGTALYKLLLFIYLPIIAAKILLYVFRYNTAVAFIAVLLIVLVIVLSIVYYILYLSYLAMAKRMLSK